ncbi:hypothetical protein NQ315_010402 [Exocentrus adspersus]|uniref:Uncharacterized protein n=1 Tax=Exocentrus adspersus TaxID=1586481 RepID=A0AAV8WC85_9CUCU|nr:hypothetical protein NQ315_010402 [Exocentrus adspersus]
MSAGRSQDSPNDRLRRAKSEAHNRISTETIRTEFRDRFFRRLRTTRSRSVDRLRQIVESQGNSVEFKSISDVRKALLGDSEASSLLQTDEVNDLLNEIEEELRQFQLNKQGEEYIKSVERETEDMVSRLLSECQICGKMSQSGIICVGCSVEISTEFK